MSRSNYAQGFAQDFSSNSDPQLGSALDGVRTSFDKPPVRRSKHFLSFFGFCLQERASLA